MSNEILNKKLIDVINSSPSDLDRIKILLSAGADINQLNTASNHTPLMHATKIGNEEAADFLLWQGANPLIMNSLGNMASNLSKADSQLYLKLKDFELLYATVNNDIKAVKSIVGDGALVDFQGMGGYSALMIAVEEGLNEMVDYFLDLGADMTLKCYDGRGVFELVTDSDIHSSLVKMKTFRAEILNRPEIMTFRFFMRPYSNKFTSN